MSMSHDYSAKFVAPYSPAISHFSQSSMADPNQQARQPSYPSPHNSYPSPQMPAYSYPPPQGQSGAEPYRSPQQNTNNSLSLPPLRLEPQPGQQQPGQAPMGSPLPPPQHGMPQYFAHPGQPQHGQAMNMGSQHLGMRYQLPPQAGEQRILSGGRHKKEIKRRTKTGCLTCRKRRIKCDEAHPVCRNCQKSKRDCLGYDPIFKQQPGPTQIQPAPNNNTPHQASAPAPSPPTPAVYAAQIPQGYAPASSAGYAPPPPMTGSGHPQHDSFNNSAIDPALAATDPAMQSQQQQYNGVHALGPALRGASYSSAASNGPVKGNKMNISDIFKIANHNPPEVPSRDSPITQELDEEFRGIFKNDYCLGLDVMLETKWYSTNNNALSRVFADRKLHEEAVFFTETMKYKTNANDMSGIFSQEARLLWHLLETCRHTNRSTGGANGITNAENEDLSLSEVRARLDILEALLTNQTLSHNPVHQLSYRTEDVNEKSAELAFWDNLGEFVVHADSEPPNAEYALSRMRAVLQAHEVRDAIYSIAIARHVGNRVRGFPDALPSPVDQNPENDLNKLSVAMAFISHECRSGSQQILARICDMALLSWTVSRTS